jgi:predicted Zn-dependent protease
MSLDDRRSATRDALASLKLVRIGEPISQSSLESFAEKIVDSFLFLIQDVSLVQYDPPPFDAIEARLLTRSLDEEVGGHILGVTGADLVDSSGDDFFSFMFGGKDNSNDVAVVSTRRLLRDGAEVSPELAGARLLKVAIHELGHNFGLLHHYGHDKADDGAYCPMTKGDFNRFGEHGYVRAVIDARGFRFCRGCETFLRERHA